MIRRSRAILFTTLTLLSLAAVHCVAQPQAVLTRHVREATVSGAAKLTGRMPASETLRLVLVLPLRNQSQLDTFLEQLQTPSSPYFRQFLTVDEFTAKYGPTQRDYDALVHFANVNGLEVAGTSRNRLNLDVRGTVASIEKAFNIHLGIYRHPTENRTFYAPDREPRVDLPFPLWHISGLDNYSRPHSQLHRRSESLHPQPLATTGSCPDESFCGSDMRGAYYEATTLTGSGQNLGLLEYYGTDLTDLMTYYTNAHQTYPTGVVHLVSTDGTSTSCTAADGCDDTEQTIDMTQALGMAPGLTGLYMFVGSTDTALLNGMATASPLPAQLSSSWTWSPADPSTDNPYFQEYAAQGQNYFQAAGDSGKWPSSASSFEDWPADDVYITSVGGTDLTTTGPGGDWASESCWADGGGGPSPDKFTIPSWQTAAASTCSSGGLKCSTTYRNGPDVSANANFTFYVCADQTTCTANSYGGTSFAAPMWAGYLALINEQVTSGGGSTLGFINPTLYSILAGSNYDTDFHDVISGSNGYSAGTGYDLCSGLGSPNGSGLINGFETNFTIAASPSTLTIAPGGSGTSTITTALVGSFDAAITLSAAGQPTGVTITFSPNPIPAPGGGTSTMTVNVAATAAPGTYTITVTGTGGTDTHPTTVTLTIGSLIATTTSLTSTPNPSAIGQKVTFTATVTGASGGTPTGMVTFYDGTTSLGTGALNTSGVATLATTNLTPGTHSITATYGGSSTNAGSTSSVLRQMVQRRL